jgi:hypothetical protein
MSNTQYIVSFQCFAERITFHWVVFAKRATTWIIAVEYLTHSTNKYPHLLFVSKLLKNLSKIIPRKKPTLTKYSVGLMNKW